MSQPTRLPAGTASICPLVPQPKPLSQQQAERLLLQWLMWLPDGADAAAAARTEIARIDASGTRDCTARALRALLVQVAGATGCSD